MREGGAGAMPDNAHYQHARHRLWREKILRRAKYRCEECARFGRNVDASHAHHVQSVEEYPELAYTLSNGKALCTGCHNKLEPRGDIAARKRGKR